MDFFYRNNEWYSGQFVRKIIPKIEISKKSILYFSTVFNKIKPILLSVLVRDVDKIFCETKIKLPVKNFKIDFKFMEDVVSVLESEFLIDLEKYLIDEFNRDYKITDEEQSVIDNYNNIEWGKFRIGDLFYKIKTNSLKYKTSDLPNISNEIYSLPALTAGVKNQGLNNFVPKYNATILKRVLSIASNGVAGITFFQSREFTVLQDAYAIDIKKDLNYILADNHYLFFACVIMKSIYNKFEWSNKAIWSKVENEKINLPINNGKIDFNIMNLIISYIKKFIFKDVDLKYEDRINKAKELINQSLNEK